MKKYHLWGILLCLSAFFSDLSAQTAGSFEKPNILWITCEDMSPHLSCYGDSTVSTPNIDRLAREGIRFSRMFSTAGVCAPSRASIITGMYHNGIGANHMRTSSAHRVGLPDYEAVPPPEVKCFTEYLRANGYYCSNNAKTDYQFATPFTAWDESSNQAHWRKRPEGKPFFSVFNFGVTHESQIWIRAGKPLRVDPEKISLPPYYPDTEVIRRDVARYYDNIMVLDSLIGDLLSQLEEDGLMDNTIIFFFSDHGAGLPWYKRELYDRGIQVPFIVRFPDGREAGGWNQELHSFVDLAPTVLSLTGTPAPAHLQGQAFLGSQKVAKPREYVFAARDRMDEYDMVRAVRDKRFKYIRNYQPDKPNYQNINYRKKMALMQEILRLKEEGKLPEITRRWFRTKPVEELYDLEKDPYELNNLAGDPRYRETLQRMRREENRWVMNVRDKGFYQEIDLIRMMWPGLKQPLTAQPEIAVRTNNGKQMIHISCPTEQASIGYKVNGEKGWRLYTKPFPLSPGQKLTVKAIRYGYKESEPLVLNQ